MIKAKINVSKIDKTKLYQGEKGKYLDIVLLETINGQYGDYMIVQEISKEEREAGKKGAILGNGKIFTKGGGGARPAAAATPKPKAEAPRPARPAKDDDDEVPF